MAVVRPPNLNSADYILIEWLTMTDPEYARSKTGRLAGKELNRVKNLVDKYLNVTKDPAIKVNSRLAKSNLTEADTQFSIIKTEVSKAIDSLEDSDDFTPTEIQVIETRWETEMYQHDVWKDDRLQVLQTELDKEAREERRANAATDDVGLKRDYDTLHSTTTNTISSLKATLPTVISPQMFEALKTRYTEILKNIDVDLAKIAQSRARLNSQESDNLLNRYHDDK